MDDENVRILTQYLNALDEASEQLEQMYLSKNAAGMKKVKDFMKEAQTKIKILLMK